MAGVILLRDYFGKHLDSNNNNESNNQTADQVLELQSFGFAIKVPSEFWSKVVIDGHPVVNGYIKEESSDITITKSEEWKAMHLQKSSIVWAVPINVLRINEKSFRAIFCTSNSQS